MANEGKGFSGLKGTAYTSTETVDGQDPGAASTEILEVTKWTLDPTAAVSKYNSNKTGGHKKAIVGVRDTKGTIEIKVDGESGTQLQPGSRVALKLQADEAGNDYYEISEAIIAGTPIEVDVEEGSVVGATYPFEASDCAGFGIFAAHTGDPGVAP